MYSYKTFNLYGGLNAEMTVRGEAEGNSDFESSYLGIRTTIQASIFYFTLKVLIKVSAHFLILPTCWKSLPLQRVGGCRSTSGVDLHVRCS